MNILLSSIFGFLLIVVFSTDGSLALRCLSCNGVVSPRHCHSVRNCDQHEICVTEKLRNANGKTYYNVGCRSSETCQNQHRKKNLRETLYQCSECCQYDLCNLRGCKAPAYPLPRGSICYSCRQSFLENSCDNIQVCGVDEVCYIQGLVEFGDKIFTTRCVPKTNCHIENPFGKKRADGCHICCDNDLCNNNCTNPDPIKYPRTCKEALELGSTSSGRYELDLFQNGTLIYVQCDMETDGGGWTIFQRRFVGTLNFNRGWEDYKYGFGMATGEYWLGNEAIHALTKQDAELYLREEGIHDIDIIAQYGHFRIGNETSGYKLTLSDYSGNVDLLNFNNGQAFSTKDNDQDGSTVNCAVLRGGGFWYTGNCFIRLNGDFVKAANSTMMLREK